MRRHVPADPQAYTMATFTIYVSLPEERGTVHHVEVDVNDTVGAVLEKAAEALGVAANDITLHHDGVPLGDDVTLEVTGTMLGEGSEVEAAVSLAVMAKRALGEMEYCWGERDLQLVVSECGKSDEEVSVVAQLMLDADPRLCSWNAACEAAERGLLATLKTLVSRCGTDNRQGQASPLQLASLNGHLPVVQYLVDAGASLTAIGMTPLDYATMYKQEEVAAYLGEKKK